MNDKDVSIAEITNNVTWICLDGCVETVSDDDDTEYFAIRIMDSDFAVTVSDEEFEVEYSKHKSMGDSQTRIISTIAALKKLTKFLEISLDIGFDERAILK